jgi:hypothetical protein
MALDHATVFKTPTASDAALSKVVRCAPPELHRSRAAYVALRGTGVARAVLVWTASRMHLAASLPATVVRDGRLLHAA